MVPGRDGCLVTPPRSKPDQWGETHCPFTIFIGLSAREGDPCDALRDIELREACPDDERGTTPLFADEDGSPLTHSILDSLLKAALLHACGEAAAKIYTWHSYRSGLATALHAAGVPDAVIMLMCRWMCEASLHVYRRSGAVAHEANFWAATRADVSNIQAANVPNVVMDQGMADVADFCSRHPFPANAHPQG